MKKKSIPRIISQIILWLLPLSFPNLSNFYHATNLQTLLIAGIFYTLIVIAAILIVLPAGTLKQTLSSPPIAAALILIFGGAVMWLSGSLGPPDHTKLMALYLNSGGLLAAHIIVLIGFVVLTSSFWDIGNRSLLLLGLTSFIISTIFWISQRMILWSAIDIFPAGLNDVTTISELKTFLSHASSIFITVYFVAGYLASTAFGYALWKCKWIGNAWGIIILIVSVTMAIVELARILPFALPPALVSLLPYFIGVNLLTKTGKNKTLQPRPA